MERVCGKVYRGLMVMVLAVVVSGNANGRDSRYARLVNLAELAITEQNFKEALVYYDSAFAAPAVPFAQDLYNGALCAIKSGNFSRAGELSMLIAAKGVGENFFLKSKTFAVLQSRKGWEGLIVLATHTRQALAATAACQSIDGLLHRSDRVDSAFYANFDPAKEFHRAVVADSLSRALLGMLNTRGYPSEEDIGVMVINDTLLSPLPKYAILLLRRGLLVNPAVDSTFKNILLNIGVKEGKLKAEAYISMTLHSLLPAEVALRNYYTWIDCAVYRPQTLHKETVDSFRNSIGACSLDDYTQKLMYNVRYPQQGFLIITSEVNQGPYYRKRPDELAGFLERYEVDTLINSGCPY